jgi:hypothetical protein
MSTTPLSTQSKAARKHNSKIRKKSKEELKTENYRRQIETLFEKIHRLATSFGADIFIQARRKSKQNLYTSFEDLSWPPRIKDIVVSLQLAFILHLANLAKANSYPLPAIMTPTSFEARIAKRKIK